MTRVAVLGLGRMGRPIARRLASVFEVGSYDPAHGDGSAASIAADADVLVTVLPGPPEARAALLDEGALDALAAGALWLDLTSNDPRVVDELVDAAAARGIRSAAAPMAGGPAEASAGDLRFFVAAAPTDRRLVGELLAPLGRPFQPFAGEHPAQAHLVKLLANGLWFQQAVAVTEAFELGKTHGLDPELLRVLLAQSAGGSVFLERHAPLLIAGDDMADFGLHRVVEELDALEALGATARTPHELLGLVADIHRRALASYGPVDGELLGARFHAGSGSPDA